MTLIELMVVVALVGILASLSVWGFRSVVQGFSQRNFVNDIASSLGSGRLRAMTTQRNVIFVFDMAVSPAAYYELDDISTTQTLNTQADLATVAASFKRSASGYNLTGAGYSVRLVDEGTATNSFLVKASSAWPGFTSFPFPFSSVAADTTNGCTFCTATGRAALAFRPDGRVIFSDANANTAMGGAFVFGQQKATSTNAVEANRVLRRAVLVSVSGHVESLSQ